MPTFALAMTAVVVVSRLFRLLVSTVSLVTEALLDNTVPEGTLEATRATMVIVRTPPLARLLKVQTVGTLPGMPALQLPPPLAVTDTTLSVAGSRSLTLTLTAVEGPLFVMVKL